jgi:hypothetical protein
MDNTCERYAFDITGMIIQINDRLKEIKTANNANDRIKYNDLISLIYSSFGLKFTLGKKKPGNCNEDILSFMTEVIDKNPTWFKPSHRKIYTVALNNEDVVAVIREVQDKINEKGLFRGGGGGGGKK